ncbi:nucleoside triphosphate pyrophosphohydrolase family protein [Streptomyces sp. ISL-112]|uniref:nucleoside triphosphate pyrophosphohydrolase family protein n=1 Tax=unclassified Streptomyces TaxID=2593676 RepID=UPI001BE73BB3|nr:MULTISPECIES: nucleoside triphosphate pyrophosphohydrolase family protein [unclassified Streptomyces]MBT2430449.1 nucleoside triphosphate pyrophosphohydrolase family protein [Streptomyces sp. ISL-112]MBT2462281.1 nucleoside triphosphate pyrophosphohydrolase family protein [Streptomyces sp. ISL-63]
MDLNRYQQAAIKTLQDPAPGTDPVVVPLLGLVGEVGSLATAYKKRLRDGPGLASGKQHLREELGDVLWYVAALAHRFDLNLEDVAAANLVKIGDWWRPTPPADRIVFDADFPESERLPRQATLAFALQRRDRDGRTVAILTRDGKPCGDPLTDASHIDDDYRFHDIFHLAHAAVLGWSPVSRFLLGCKRKSDAKTDEAEDGGRAIAIEEGISALVFSYATSHGYFENIRHIDHEFIKTITSMTSHLEVSVLRSADWEQAIMTGYDAWRQLRAQGGGTVHLDLDEQSLVVEP